MTQVLVLGAAGFLGGHVQRKLKAQGVQVVGTARDKPGYRRLELNDQAALRALLEELRPGGIINCAGRTSGSLGELVRDNVASVSTLIEAVRAVVPEARLVQFGSAAEYGPSSPETLITEAACPHPEGGYGVTKLAATLLVQTEASAGRLNAVVLRVFNPVGSGMPEGGLPGRAAKLIRAALERNDSSITLGSLEAYRDFVDARDVAEAAVLAALGDSGSETLLNVASGQPTQVRHLVHTLAEVAGFRGDILESASGSPRSGTVSWQQASIERAQHSLGWTPRFVLHSSLSDLWNG